MSHPDQTDSGSDHVDHVDHVIDQWNRERPDLDVSAMAIIGRIGRLEKTIQPRLDAVFAQHDLESWEFDVLATLLRNGAPHQLTPGELIASMMITSGTMTNRIDRLEQRGFVTRTVSQIDARKRLVKLTTLGREKADAALIDHVANESKLVSALSAKQRTELTKLLRLLSPRDRSDP